MNKKINHEFYKKLVIVENSLQVQTKKLAIHWKLITKIWEKFEKKCIQNILHIEFIEFFNTVTFNFQASRFMYLYS